MTISKTGSSLVRPATVYEPARGWLALNLGEVWRYRELLYFLIWRDVKVRYKQTILGPLCERCGGLGEQCCGEPAAHRFPRESQ